MDEMFRYIFTTLRKCDARHHVVSGILKKQKSFNRGVKRVLVLQAILNILLLLENREQNRDLDDLRLRLEEMRDVLNSDKIKGEDDMR